MDAADYVEQIRQFGVDFRVKTADELEIRRAGSYFDAPELNSLLDAVRANYRPTTDLSGSVEQVEVIDNPGGGAQVFIRFTVRSEGAPSIAQGYSLHVAHASLRSIDIKVPAEELDTEITLPPAGGREKIVIRPPDALARKTRNAVVRGYPVSGWLRFVLDAAPARIDADDLRQPALVFFVSFADAKGTRYEALRETQ